MRNGLLIISFFAASSVIQADGADTYQSRVQPYIEKYCVECHGSTMPKGDLDLTRFTKSSDVIASFRRWNNVIEFIHDGEMPPEESRQPSIDESNAVVADIRSILIAEAKKQAGDPGVVLPRRLSNTEYDLSIRELTGVDIRPTKDFPADPAGGEGFDNTGEALGMSPNLLKKYLSAAQLVADHLVLKPDGISFAPYPVTSYNERKKLTEGAIIDFYESHAVDTLEYLEAAWRYRYRADGQEAMTIQQWADTSGLSPSYLAIVWNVFADVQNRSGFLDDLGQAWDAIPAPTDDSTRPAELLKLHDIVKLGRRVLAAPEEQLIKANAGNWPISHLAFRAKVAAARDKFEFGNLKSETLLKIGRISKPSDNDPQAISAFIRIEPAFSVDGGYVIVNRPLFSKADQLPQNQEDEEKQEVKTLRSVLEETHPELVKVLAFGTHPKGTDIDPDSFVVEGACEIEIPLTPEMQLQLEGRNLLVKCQLDSENSPESSVFVRSSMRERPGKEFIRSAELLIKRNSEAAKQLATSATVFCNAFPNRFFYVDEGRGLAAGFHLVEGFFRDDQPLVTKVLDEQQKATLDRLWRELDFVTQSAETLLRGFVWFERSEREVLHDKRFDFLSPEDPELVNDTLLTKFEKLYLDKMGVKRVGDLLEPELADTKFDMIHSFFLQIRAGLTLQRELTSLAEPLALNNLEQLARRAYRRSLRADERESLHSLYAQLRADGQDVEHALRGVLIGVLMSPDFCYHYHTSPDGDSVYPLSDNDLASRLSYFLWSSPPDEELLNAAAAGKLQSEEDLLNQTRRMLKDPRVESFSREFFGQWLRYRDYLSKDPINAAAFPGYDDELRQAIFEEPVHLATDLIQTDQPVTNLLTSDVTFVNRRLAKHYGAEIEQQYSSQVAKAAAEHARRGHAAADHRDQSWYRVNDLRKLGRGGLFGMAVVLTKNSAGDRTSPVKRGFWSVHHLLGQHFPPPPADIPELPKSEKDAPHTIRDLLASHVADTKCAMCHKHFDGLGLAMEGFDAIGRARTTDLAGRAIDDVAKLPNGETAEGIPGLVDYIDQHRRQDFIRTMCRKFLGYALGRSVTLSDQLLLDEMETALEKNENRFSVLFEVVVRSPQFRNQRGRDFVTAGR